MDGRRCLETVVPKQAHGGIIRGITIERARPTGTGTARSTNDHRLDGANPFGDSLVTQRNWRLVDAVRKVADAIGETPARVALAWVLARPGVDTGLMEVRRVAQAHDNIAATDLRLPPDLIVTSLL